jgi:hypothetical protein
LIAKPEQRSTLAEALARFAVEEMDLESSRVAVSLSRVEQSADRTSVVLYIPDFVNG